MIRIRKAQQRGHFDHGWLNTHHTFSFGQYHDPDHMAFRSLRVMNEDVVQPDMGFGMHSHKDMEIITYVLAGALEHKDSIGNGAVLRPGEFQRMSAGTGIQHSEFNPSPDEPVHFYQIWLLPDRPGHTPSYEQKSFDPKGRQGQLQLVASPNAANDSLTIHQNAKVYLADLQPNQTITHQLPVGHHAWVQVLRGHLQLNDTTLNTADGAAVSDETSLTLKTTHTAEVMLFELS